MSEPGLNNSLSLEKSWRANFAVLALFIFYTWRRFAIIAKLTSYPRTLGQPTLQFLLYEVTWHAESDDELTLSGLLC
jgi:hypothetical protein